VTEAVRTIPDAHQLAGEIRRRARELGFDLVGIGPARPSAYREYMREWLASGQAGTMRWMEGRFEERTDPGAYLPGARSVVCVAMNYFVPLEEPAGEWAGKVSRYELGVDYHEIIKGKLHELADWIRAAAPAGTQTRAAVDTGPVMEKELAQLAGVGWVGKNTCLINERIGSWVLLGEVITTAELPADEPAVDRCGTCRRCIDACPTGAITGPYTLDARKCISYLTIEHREDISEELQGQMGEWLYGCDICQDVCPWNKRAPVATMPELRPRFASGTLDVREVLGWSAEDYRRELKGSAMKRVKLPILQRNARIVEKNLNERR
jgi:epoxyqueuosine reductase